MELEDTLAAKIEKLWLEADDEQCQQFVDRLAAELNCNRHHLYGCLTNLLLVINPLGD